MAQLKLHNKAKLLHHIYAATLEPVAKMMNKKLIKKRSFTLVELIVVISLVVISASAVGISIYRAIETTRYEASIECLKNKFRTAWELSRLARIQVTVSVRKVDDDYFTFLDSELLPANSLIKKWWSKPQRLEGITKIVLKVPDADPHEEFKIVIDPAGMARFDDTIEITSRFGNKEKPYILKPVSFTDSETIEDLQKQSHDLYPKDLPTKDSKSSKKADPAEVSPSQAVPPS